MVLEPKPNAAQLEEAGEHAMTLCVQERIASFPSHIAVKAPSSVEVPFVIVQPGAIGYWPLSKAQSLQEADSIVESVFGARQPTDAEREAASNGSVFGWDVPAADPELWAQKGLAHHL